MRRDRSWTYTPRTMAALGVLTFFAAMAAVFIRSGSVDVGDVGLSVVAGVIVMLVFRWRWKY